MSDPNETPEAKAQRFQDERDEARAQVQTWRNWSDEVVPPWGRTDDRGDDGQRTLISERMTALVRQDGALSERLARVGVERDIAMRERDSVITRLERAERERDRAAQDYVRAIGVQARIYAERDKARTQRDAAVARADLFSSQIVAVTERAESAERQLTEVRAELSEASRVRDEALRCIHDEFPEMRKIIEERVERDTAEAIAVLADTTGAEYDADATDSSDWYVKAARLLREFAADIRSGAFKRGPA